MSRKGLITFKCNLNNFALSEVACVLHICFCYFFLFKSTIHLLMAAIACYYR